MNAQKFHNANRVCCLASRGPGLILELMPESLVKVLTGRQIGEVIRLAEATYLDGYHAGGGDTCSTVSHCELHRRSLLKRLEQ